MWYFKSSNKAGLLSSRYWEIEAKNQQITCVVLEGGPCSPCKERAAIRRQIKQLEEELAKLNAKLDTVGTMMNAIHDPFIHKLPPEVASHILRLSLPTMNNRECDQQAIHGESSNIQEEWTAPLKLGFVCRKWRQLTWATPDLWTTLYLAINPSLASSTVESLPGLLREWLHRSGALPLTIHFFHDIQDSLSSSDKHSNADDTRMIESLEAATCSVINILNLHSSRWRSLNLQAAVDVLERFSSLVEPKQLVALDLTATTCRNIPQILPNFMVESKLNLTHLKLTNFPLTSINIRWDNITHATFSNIATREGLDFLRRSTSLEFYCVFMYGSRDVSFVNPILHRRLRSFELSPGYHLESVLEAINLPSLEEWTIDVGLHRTTLVAMQTLLKRSGCFLKVLNLRKLGTSSEDLHTLLQSIPSLERMRLISMRVSADEFPLEILTQILWSDPGNSDISVGNATSAPLLPHIQVIEYIKQGPFPWGRIQRLYRQGHRRALTLKVSITQANITDKTALQLLRLTEEGVKLQIIDLTSGEDFLQNFKKKKFVQGV